MDFTVTVAGTINLIFVFHSEGYVCTFQSENFENFVEYINNGITMAVSALR